MSIPASHIVQVSPRLLQPGGRDLELNGLLLSRSERIPADEPVLPFTDPESVAAWFGVLSDEARLADIYFTGYDNSFAKPRALYIARRLSEPAAPFLRGGALSTALEIRDLPAGTLTLNLDMYGFTLEDLDFSAITSLSDAALILQSALNAQTEGGDAWTKATVSYSSLDKAFRIVGGAAGAERSISFATGTLAQALRLTQETGALLSQGADALSPEENMDKIIRRTQNWACCSTVYRADEAEALGLARWSSDQGVAYLYVHWDNDPRLLQSGASATTPSRFKEENLSSVTTVYPSASYAAFVLGAAASIAWDRRQGVISFAFKSQDGLAACVDNAADAAALAAQGVNFMGNYATRNDQFVFLYPGQMCGRWSWIDAYLNAVWFNNALQAALMAGLAAAQRVPYTEQGYALIRAWMQDPVNRALQNGIIDPGLNLSQLQKAQLNREAGLDITPYLQQEGYFIQVSDPGPNARMTRQSPVVSLWYTYGGSINKLQVASTAVV